MKSRNLIATGVIFTVAVFSLNAFAQKQDPADKTDTSQSHKCGMQMRGMMQKTAGSMHKMMSNHSSMDMKHDMAKGMMSGTNMMTEQRPMDGMMKEMMENGCPMMNNSQKHEHSGEMTDMKNCDMQMDEGKRDSTKTGEAKKGGENK